MNELQKFSPNSPLVAKRSLRQRVGPPHLISILNFLTNEQSFNGIRAPRNDYTIEEMNSLMEFFCRKSHTHCLIMS